MRQEVFDLSSDITLVYGANGTGKSSLCEALETAMLGSISEAQVKRVDHRTYCNNARLRRHVTPQLFAQSEGEDVTLVTPSEEDYRFCFIEKNRLDDFARIAARTPSDQRQLIATLFGVDQFSDFVRGFNPSLDENLTLVNAKAQQLDFARAQLAASQQTVQSHAQRFADIEQQEQELAQRTYPGQTFEACCLRVLGTEEQQGRLPYLHAALEAAPPILHGVTPAKLQTLLDETYRLHGLWQTEKDALSTRAGEVSYSQLYNAVLALAEGATSCPACGTALDRVSQNPFDRAREGVQQLAELAAIQQREAEFGNQLHENLRALLVEMKKCAAAAAAVCPANLAAANLPTLPDTSAGTWPAGWVDNDQQAWNALLGIAGLIEQSDAQARTVNNQRQALAKERARLDGFRLEIERLKTLRSTANEDLARAQQTIAQFEEQNQALIVEVAEEQNRIAHHLRIKAAYDAFLPELQHHLAGLPARFLQGLGEQARDLYNAFNRDDPPTVLLQALWLPLSENGKIEVEFTGEPGVRYDALVILSEGHIKCLGLAILLAKNLAQNCPVVIFDDVVNAIDDEHRDGIWRTFFEGGLLDGKQVILTSHAEEFLHRIQQELGAERAASIKRYKFLPPLGEYELRVDTDPPTKNYVLLAQESLEREDKRDALRHARPAIESLTDRVWNWLGRHGDGRLELKLGGPRAQWELHNKCTKLRSALRRIPSPNPGIQAILAALHTLLGVNGASIEWGYLNSGVHDSQRDHEFDRATVRSIVQAVVELDAGLMQLPGR